MNCFWRLDDVANDVVPSSQKLPKDKHWRTCWGFKIQKEYFSSSLYLKQTRKFAIIHPENRQSCNHSWQPLRDGRSVPVFRFSMLQVVFAGSSLGAQAVASDIFCNFLKRTYQNCTNFAQWAGVIVGRVWTLLSIFFFHPAFPFNQCKRCLCSGRWRYCIWRWWWVQVDCLGQCAELGSWLRNSGS